MASLALRQVSKVFHPPARVLDNVTLEVRDGEFLAILGPSGCGKSTILRCLAGLEPPTTGDLFIGERRVNDVPPAERDVAMVFQNYALYPHLTVRQNLEFPLRMRGVGRERREQLVREAAARLELGPLLERMPGQLSGGQRQRVALGRALVRQPAAFLFDEPLSNLDAALRVQLRTELMGLHAQLGATMLYVTHDQVEALTMGQRLAVLDQGRVQQIGTPREVFDRPANIFVARFVGSPGMNVLAGAIAAGEGSWFQAGALRLPLAPTAGVPGYAGVRPERVRVEPPEAGGAPARVRTVERLGSETLVHLDMDGGPLVARLPGLAALDPGDAVSVTADPSGLYWFGPDGARL